MIKFIISLCMLLGFSSIGLAQSEKCGVAGYFFKDTTLFSSASRFVVNMTFFPSSTLGMTFGTSGCKTHKLVNQDKKALHLVTVAKHDLQLQMAQGSGDHVDALSFTMGCRWTHADEFRQTLKSNYQGIFHQNDMEPSAILDRVEYYIGSNKELSQACGSSLS